LENKIKDAKGRRHGIKGFVLPTKSFVKIGITKVFCYNNKMFSSINKTFGCCSKIFGCSNKNLFVVPYFAAVTKPFFSVVFKYIAYKNGCHSANGRMWSVFLLLSRTQYYKQLIYVTNMPAAKMSVVVSTDVHSDKKRKTLFQLTVVDALCPS